MPETHSNAKPQGRLTPYTRAALCALLVTVLWSSSWVLIRIGLRDEPHLPPLPFAGLRYLLAFLCLLPFALGSAKNRVALRNVSPRGWGELAVLGVFLYALAQGGQFAALALLPSATVSLVLNLTAPFVAVIGVFALREHPTRLQWAGMAVALAGILTYFGLTTGKATPLPAGQWLGLGAAVIGMVSNVLGAIFGRRINRETHLSPLLVTTISMGIGAILLLIGGFTAQGIAVPTARGWAIIAWLAVVNTAVAFTLWNVSLRVLTALESSLILSTMMIQICLLSWLLLHETLTPWRIAGVLLTGLGVLLVQWRRS